MENDTKVIVDEKSVTADLRAALSKAKKITFIGTDPSDTYTAEYLDTNAGIDATLEPAPKGSTPSQRRSLMDTICTRKDKPDLVFSSSAGESNAGTGTSLKGVLTGRAELTVSGKVEVLRCLDRMKTGFNISVEIKQGIYNSDSTKLSQILGHGYAKALMTLAGKAIPLDKK